MASLRNLNHRRRSQSASGSSPVSHRSPDDAGRAATKRGYSPHQFTSPSSPGQWDVDFWRRGKKRRCDTSPSHESVDANRSQTSQKMWAGVSSFPAPAFAATSAEFHFFPEKAQRNLRPRQSTQQDQAPPSPLNAYPQADLHHLRSVAFWELHRSVAENGEGLVQRMRDYEHLRSRSDVYLKAKEAQKRGRKRSSLIMPSHKTIGSILTSDGEDDDIQIFAGEPHDPRHKKRAVSLVTDEAQDPHHTEYISFVGGDRCPSPSANSNSSFVSDDEMYYFSSSPRCAEPTTSTPALSQTLSSSTNSSLISLALPPPLTLSPPLFFGDVDAVALASSKSEKAIAALTLAMANGAGGLNDYRDVQVMEISIMDDSQVGELWH